MNCHFVTRSLVVPWEWRPGMLRYYDFSANRVRKGRTRTLFAKENVNSPQIEGLLNRYIEKPLADFTKRAIEERYDPPDLDWRTLRALLLYFLFQAPRFGQARDLSSDYLEKVLDRGEPFIDAVARSVAQEQKLINLPTEPGHFFFFPELGMFPFPVQDEGCVTGYTYGFALPLTPRNCLAMVSTTVTEASLKESCRSIHAFSAGRPSNDTRVLIPPVVDKLSPELLAQGLAEYRKQAGTIIDCVTGIRELVSDAYAKIGIQIEQVQGSFSDRCQLPAKPA